MSLSARRAWIEIICPLRGTGPAIVALRKESVDRNNNIELAPAGIATSLSARRAWIEMMQFVPITTSGDVALRKESVDRNVHVLEGSIRFAVALRKESVDRNWILTRVDGFSPTVALRKESVDRNNSTRVNNQSAIVALRKESVDRNTFPGSSTPKKSVALRKESVDRNAKLSLPSCICVASLSARRAWIEIYALCISVLIMPRRSPQGERG